MIDRFVYEVSLFLRVMKQFPRWYRNTKRDIMISDCLETRKGRKKIAMAMINPIHV